MDEAHPRLSAWALGRVYVLIDARHGLKPVDEAILDTLGKAAVSHEIVLTKCDQVSEVFDG